MNDNETLKALDARVQDLQTAVGQLQSILQRDHGLLPPPPKHLQVRVVGGYVGAFIESGFQTVDTLNHLLAPVGKQLGDFNRILDFGCGCARNTRAIKRRYPAADVHGTDIDPEAIAWLQANLAPIGDFRVAPHRPPTSYGDGYFDFVFGISVFTHLPEDMQFEWLTELRRITRPDALLLLTTHGEKTLAGLPDEAKAAVAGHGFYYYVGTYGQSISLPDFYQNSYHSFAYIQREWSRYFDVLAMTPTGVQHQDAILLRRTG